MRNITQKQLKICYSLVREQNLLKDMIEETENKHHENYLKMKVDAIEQLLGAFPLIVRMNCRSMHADKRNYAYDRYEHGNWVVHQTNKIYGRNATSWSKAKKFREMLGLQGVPY